MVAAALNFGVTELALGKAHDVEAKAKPPVPQAIADLIVKTLGGWLAGAVENKARQFAELAVWFNGAQVSLGDERVNRLLDLNDRLVSELEEAEHGLLKMREHTLKLINELERARHADRLIAAFRAVVGASTDLYEALSAFKWAVMENDAEMDIRNGNFEVFGNADTLIASLRS